MSDVHLSGLCEDIAPRKVRVIINQAATVQGLRLKQAMESEDQGANMPQLNAVNARVILSVIVSIILLRLIAKRPKSLVILDATSCIYLTIFW
jgi:hypothetical protein